MQWVTLPLYEDWNYISTVVLEDGSYTVQMTYSERDNSWTMNLSLEQGEDIIVGRKISIRDAVYVNDKYLTGVFWLEPKYLNANETKLHPSLISKYFNFYYGWGEVADIIEDDEIIRDGITVSVNGVIPVSFMDIGGSNYELTAGYIYGDKLHAASLLHEEAVGDITTLGDGGYLRIPKALSVDIISEIQVGKHLCMVYEKGSPNAIALTGNTDDYALGYASVDSDPIIVKITFEDGSSQQFNLFTLIVSGYVSKQANVLQDWAANATWLEKGYEGLLNNSNTPDLIPMTDINLYEPLILENTPSHTDPEMDREVTYLSGEFKYPVIYRYFGKLGLSITTDDSCTLSVDVGENSYGIMNHSDYSIGTGEPWLVTPLSERVVGVKCVFNLEFKGKNVIVTKNPLSFNIGGKLYYTSVSHFKMVPFYDGQGSGVDYFPSIIVPEQNTTSVPKTTVIDNLIYRRQWYGPPGYFGGYVEHDIGDFITNYTIINGGVIMEHLEDILLHNESHSTDKKFIPVKIERSCEIDVLGEEDSSISYSSYGIAPRSSSEPYVKRYYRSAGKELPSEYNSALMFNGYYVGGAEITLDDGSDNYPPAPWGGISKRVDTEPDYFYIDRIVTRGSDSKTTSVISPYQVSGVNLPVILVGVMAEVASRTPKGV